MKYLPLIWAGLWRKPARTCLTLFSIVVAFILFGLLQGVDSAFNNILSQQKLDRMFVDSRYFQPVPYSYKAQIEKVKGITKITEIQFMGGYYQDQKDGLFAICTIPSIWLAIRPEWEIPQAQIDAVGRTRNGAIVAEWLAKKHGWKIGDTFTLKGGMPKKDMSTDWPFEVVGIMRNTDAGEARMFLANYVYLNESRMETPGTAGMVSRYLLRIDDANHAVRIARQIDALFANSPVATRSQSEQDQAQQGLARIGDFKFFTRAIMSAVFFALLFLTLNTTMESVRERTAELATLKTLGFTDTGVLMLVLAESVALFLVAATIGLAIAAALFPLAKEFVQQVILPVPVLVLGALCAIAAAVLSAIVPAWRAKRLNIVEALAVR
jgi:putative ABC transport system permease protein